MPAFDVTTISETGPASNRVHIVFLGDGYRASEINTTFRQHIQSQLDYMFDGGTLTEPFGRYANFFNVYAIDVISNQSGADDPGAGVVRDTALGASYWFDGVTERLLSVDVDLATDALVQSLAGTTINPDLLLVAVNDTKYGGAGGMFATYSAGDPTAGEIAVHEIAHSFANLGDHYTTGGPVNYTGPEPGYHDLTIDPTGAKWSRWLGYDQPGVGVIGAYEGGNYSETGVFRPSLNSKMNTLGQPFDAVARERFILEFYKIVDPLDAWTPNSGRLVDPGSISVTPIDPEIIDVRWSAGTRVLVDGAVHDLDTLGYNLISGNYNIKALAYDPTDWVRAGRKDLQQVVKWQLTLEYAEVNVFRSSPNVTGGQFVDLLSGNGLGNRLDGFRGNDTLNGGGGDDTLIGGLGRDLLNGGNGVDLADYSDKKKAISVDLQVGKGPIVVNVGLLLEDTLRSIEDLIGGSGNDTILGGGAANRFEGRKGADSLDGRGGHDHLTGQAGKDTLLGGAGNDTLLGGAGADSMAGGKGNDLYLAVDANDTVVEQTGGGDDTVETGLARYRLPDNVEVLISTRLTGAEFTGNASNNLIQGGFGNDTLDGEGGNDRILGDRGRDRMDGGSGNDTLDGGAGADTMLGGAGNDLYIVDSAADRVIEGPNAGTDRVNASVSYVLPTNVENLTLLGGAVEGTGNSLVNVIVGNNQANVINGKAGSDILEGRGGADTFVFDTPLGPTNVDKILDFNDREDVFRLDSTVFLGLKAGTLLPGQFTVGDGAGSADHRIIHNNRTGELFFDADGTGKSQVLFAVLTSGLELTEQHFQIV